MFKFSFKPVDLNDDFIVQTPKDAASNESAASDTNAIPCAACEEHHPTTEQLAKTPADVKHGLVLFAGGQEIVHIQSDALLDDLVEQQIRTSAQQGSGSRPDQHATDLIPGVYEGGGKIWECTQDLGDFLSEEDDKTFRSLLQEFSGKRVLDLGCGAGILGLLALQAGAHVHFQDYNDEIIRKITIVNAVLNTFDEEDDATQTAAQEQLERCRFFSGDWSHYVSRNAPQTQFDVILTCETIYNPSNNQKIIDVLKRMLRPDNGVAYLAAKTYYFGVGGGLRAFEALLKQDGALRSECVWKADSNVQREIIKITHATKD